MKDAILQEFDFEILYKKGSEMTVPDTLSRLFPNDNSDKMYCSPDENDPSFPYVPETNTPVIKLPNGKTLQELLGKGCSDNDSKTPTINHTKLTRNCKAIRVDKSESEYDADSENNVVT